MTLQFAEPNQARSMGTRPARSGTQVAVSADCVSGTTLVYTVTASKTLLLTAIFLSAYALDTNPFFTVFVRDAADVTVYTFLYILVKSLTGVTGAVSFPFPLEIPAGYDICMNGSIAGGNVHGFFQGWEQ